MAAVVIKNSIFANNTNNGTPSDGLFSGGSQSYCIIENGTGNGSMTFSSTADPNLGSATTCGIHTKFIPNTGSFARNNGTATGAPTNDICGVAYGTMDIGSAAYNCSTIISDGDGDWETPSTWVGGVVPVECDSVIVRHEVNVTTTTGQVKIAGLTLDNSIKPTFLEISNGDSFIVTGGASVINGNSTKDNELIINNASKLVINNNLIYSRSSTNNRTTRLSLSLDEGSQLDCHDFIFSNLGLNTESDKEIVLNFSTINIAGDFTVTHADGEDFSIVMDSSTMDIAGNVSFTRASGTRDFNMVLSGTSLFKVAGDMDVSLTGGRNSIFLFFNKSEFSIKGNYTQSMTSSTGSIGNYLNNTAAMNVGKSLTISNSLAYLMHN